MAGCEEAQESYLEHIPSVSFFLPHFVDQSFSGSLNATRDATLEHTTTLLPFSITMMGSSLLTHLQRNLIKSSLLRFQGSPKDRAWEESVCIKAVCVADRDVEVLRVRLH